MDENRLKEIKDLEYEIENVRYDIESKLMERQGIIKKYKDLKMEFIINLCILGIIYGFMRLTVLQKADNMFTFAFNYVLLPIFITIAILYSAVFIVRPAWKLYVNSNLKMAKINAQKKGRSSWNIELDKLNVEISFLQERLKALEDQYYHIGNFSD